MPDSAQAALLGGVDLLERAMGYTLGSLSLVTPGVLARPTPCAQWDVRALLVHMADSLDVLCDAVGAQVVSPPNPLPSSAPADLVKIIQKRACQLRGTCADATELATVAVYGQPLSGAVVAAAGAIEVAVHGWDLARGCGHDRPIPPSLADELGELAPLVVTADDRPRQFAYPVAVGPYAAPSDRLVAFLGREPR